MIASLLIADYEMECPVRSLVNRCGCNNLSNNFYFPFDSSARNGYNSALLYPCERENPTYEFERTRAG
jgi:hypothetical protein